jgi:GNAT superfamily N-acetyltransferase
LVNTDQVEPREIATLSAASRTCRNLPINHLALPAVIDVREIRDDELPHWNELVASVRPDRATSVESLLDWRRQAEDMAWLVATADGEEAGAGLALVGWHTPPGIGKGEAYVLPAFRGRGVGSTVYRELARWVSERGCIELESSVREDDPDSLAWVERRGFREVGRNSTLVLDLSDVEAPDIEPPEGVEVVSWSERPELARGIYDVAREASRDVPGEEDVDIGSFEDWLSRDMQGTADHPHCVFVAVAGQEVVGFAKLSFSGTDKETVWHDLTGVKRAWRRRGIGAALKRAEIAWAKREGYATLKTANAERNEPIRRLNERYGYRIEPGTVVVRAAILGPD